MLLIGAVGGFLLGRTWSAADASAPPQPLPAEPVPAPAAVDPAALPMLLHGLESQFAPFGSNCAHPSDLRTHPQFQEAVRLLSAPDVPLETVMQYVEGANWALTCAALAALCERPDAGMAVPGVERHCTHLSAWSMYFALDFLIRAPEPRVPVGAPLVGAREWWADNPFMPLLFRDYFAQRQEMGDEAAFQFSLELPTASPHAVIIAFLRRVPHPFATDLIRELDQTQPTLSAPPPEPGVLEAVGRFWDDGEEKDIFVEPEPWRQPLAAGEAAFRQLPPRSLLVSGERLTGKTSLLRLLAKRMEADGWRVFEAGGADLQAGQMYIGQLEGRIRSMIEALERGQRLIWYVPDLVQLARSGRHEGQSASMLDQILPALAAGRLVIWSEATPAGVARLTQLQPTLRSLMDVINLEPLSTAATLALGRKLIDEIAAKAEIRFQPDCAQAALDMARQYLGAAGLPGAAMLMLKLTAIRADAGGREIAPRQVVETLSQLSGLPVAILDTNERIDLAKVREFFQSRVLGQDEAVDTIVARIAMLKAGLNDPNKPIGVFLFAGPTGTGKTELAKAVATFLFGSAERLIRLDMSEFQTPDSMGKILGNAAAPLDSDSLIARVRKQPFSVLLLDEFEKAHPNVWDLFLQVFDDGRLSDAGGQVADFRHCLIILTSNLGATTHRSMGLGFAPQADVFTSEQIMRAISQTYRPEFQNRLDKVIVFQPLTRELMRGILKKELASLLERRGLKDRAWAVEWEASALEFLLEKGFSPEMGARPLKRAIDQHVLAPLAALIVEARLPEGEQFVFVRSDGRAIQAEFVDPDADASDAGALDREAGPPPALASSILAPRGTADEFGALEAEHAGVERTLASAEWEQLKARLARDMAAADFWERADRFETLSRFALMDRVQAAAETAAALRARLTRAARPSKPYSPELVGRLALQLHLVKEGIRDAIDGAPIEVALATEPVFDAGADRQAAQQWCRRLSAMYRAWSGKRRMQVTDGAGDDVLVVSGFGAHRALAHETGLHVFEASEGTGRVTARVRVAVVPPGDVPPAKQRKTVTALLESAPRPNEVVRRYRETPPLVRDGAGKWRSGRLDLALGGDFDLMKAGEAR
jgi:ATP-dependent Clp protease ATP-binding subunit ClpC